MKDITNLQKVICFTLDVHLWSGRAKLRASDIKMGTGGELPPDDLASLGSKKIVNPENIAKFENLKKEAERECLKIGVKFLGGYAIPEDKAKELGQILDEIGVRFAQEKNELLANYDALIEQWVRKHHGWEASIEGSTINRQEVDTKLQYGWQAFRILNAGEQDQLDDVLNRGLTTTAKGMAGQLFLEISQYAGQVMEASLIGRTKATQKIRSPIRAIRGKLHGLSFIDHRVKPLVQTIDHVLEQLPDSGPIEGLGLVALSGLVFILSSEERMVKHGELILAGTPVEESFGISAPQAKRVVVPEVIDPPQAVQAQESPAQDAQAAPQQLDLVVVATAAAPEPIVVTPVAAVQNVVPQPAVSGLENIPSIPSVVKRGRIGANLFATH